MHPSTHSSFLHLATPLGGELIWKGTQRPGMQNTRNLTRESDDSHSDVLRSRRWHEVGLLHASTPHKQTRVGCILEHLFDGLCEIIAENLPLALLL